MISETLKFMSIKWDDKKKIIKDIYLKKDLGEIT